MHACVLGPRRESQSILNLMYTYSENCSIASLLHSDGVTPSPRCDNIICLTLACMYVSCNVQGVLYHPTSDSNVYMCRCNSNYTPCMHIACIACMHIAHSQQGNHFVSLTDCQSVYTFYASYNVSRHFGCCFSLRLL